MALQIFQFNDAPINTFKSGDDVYFIGNEVASVLDYKDANQAVRERVDTDDKIALQVLNERNPVLNTGLDLHPHTTLINEAGLYTLVLGSRKPIAKAFKKWVCSQVLPSIRKTGTYTMPTIESKQQRVALIESACRLMDGYLNGIDERTCILFKDCLRDIVLETNTRAIGDKEYSLSRYLQEEYGINLSNGNLSVLGRKLAPRYREANGRSPAKREQYVDGTPREVNSYTLSDFTNHFKDIVHEWLVKKGYIAG
jgi:prophage antirepressor-like protein